MIDDFNSKRLTSCVLFNRTRLIYYSADKPSTTLFQKAKEKLEALFQPYHRAKHTFTREFETPFEAREFSLIFGTKYSELPSEE